MSVFVVPYLMHWLIGKTFFLFFLCSSLPACIKGLCRMYDCWIWMSGRSCLISIFWFFFSLLSSVFVFCSVLFFVQKYWTVKIHVHHSIPNYILKNGITFNKIFSLWQLLPSSFVQTGRLLSAITFKL